ncbi:MAG: DUF58 domain-containing protein [Candidatus Dormibacteria bacterium]
MTRRPTPRLAGYAALVALGVFGAVAVDRIAAIALVLPFALWLAWGLASFRAPVLELSGGLDQERVGEGDGVRWQAELRCLGAVGFVELRLALPREIACGVPGAAFRVAPKGGAPESLSWPLTPVRWGFYRIGPVAVTAEDRFGIIRCTGRLGGISELRVYPSWERLRRLANPARTQLFAGNRIARQHGEGIEFAEVRRFVPGDRVRRLNWRVTARSGTPHVNDFHLERNADVILFVDSFADLGSGQDSVLALAVRAATALADGYLGERDRVGVVGFGGVLRWLLPGMGPRHFYRVVESLLDTQVVTSYAWKAIDVIPARVLPPSATVIALTPMLDLRSVGALVNLQQRGFDLVVLEISPERFLPRSGRAVDQSALRLWQLVRVARRRSLQRAGLIVLEWPEHVSLEAVLAQVREYRRFARRSAA